MSRLVGRRAPRDELPPERRARIESALETLRAQRFFPDPKAAAGEGAAPYEFRFADCAAAAAAFRERLPALVETVKAISVAELEAEGRYDAAHHDSFFEEFPDHTSHLDSPSPPPRLHRPAATPMANANLMGMLPRPAGEKSGRDR